MEVCGLSRTCIPWWSGWITDCPLPLYSQDEDDTWVVLDFFGIVSGITACFIRLGNLMNSEIIGKVTDVPWAFIFYNVDDKPRHPGQLYEAIAT